MSEPVPSSDSSSSRSHSGALLPEERLADQLAPLRKIGRVAYGATLRVGLALLSLVALNALARAPLDAARARARDRADAVSDR